MYKLKLSLDSGARGKVRSVRSEANAKAKKGLLYCALRLLPS